MMEPGPQFADPLRAHLSLLEDQLRDRRDFLLGPEFSLADASAYHPVWFLLGMPPTRAILDEFPGIRVVVVPDDYGFDPVEGELVASSRHEVAVRREAPATGEVVVHFPRAGFRVTAF